MTAYGTLFILFLFFNFRFANTQVAIFLPLFEKCKTNGIKKDVSCPALILFVRWVCIQRRHLQARHLSSDTSQHNSIQCFSIRPKEPARKGDAIIRFDAKAREMVILYFSKTAFSQHRQEMKIVDCILLESGYRCCRSSYCARSLKLSICVRSFYNNWGGEY